MSGAWVLELAPHSITVNVVAPDPIQTDSFWIVIAKERAKGVALAKRITVGRIGTTEDVSNAFLFCFDPRNCFLTGQTLYICGGSSVGAMSL